MDGRISGPHLRIYRDSLICMIDVASRFGRLLQFSPAAILMLATPLLTACTLVVHGDDPSALHSEIDEPPAAEHAECTGDEDVSEPYPCSSVVL